MKNRIHLLLIIFIWAAPGLVFAEAGREDEESLIKLDEVVVTATKTEEKRKDIPNAVIVMDENDIRESPANSLGEFLANEPGMDWRTYGNYGGAAEEIRIRGMNAAGTQVLVNGVVMNSPSIGSADVGKIPLNNIERIEVVKGSGSLLYGTSAMGGVINIITKRPERDKVDLKAKAGYGSEDSYEISLEQGMFINDNLGYYLTASKRETDGFRDNSDLDHKDISFKLFFDKGDLLDISFYGDYIDRDYGIPGVEPPRGTEDFFDNGVAFYSDESATLLSEGADEDAHLALNIKSSPFDWLTLNLRGDYTDMESYNCYRYYSPGAGLPGGKTWVTNEVFGLETNLELKPFEAVTLLLGVAYKKYNWENRSIPLDGGGIEDNTEKSTVDEDLHTTGSFAELQYRPCPYFKLLAGIRHERHSEFGSEDVPRYGIIINPSENTALKLSCGKHFNAPTPNALFWPREDWGWGMGTEGDRNLKPETGWHTDVTMEQAFFDHKLFIILSYFDWDIDDKIRWAPDSAFFYRPENLDSYKTDGLEVGLNVGPYYGLKLSLSYTYTDAEEEKTGGVTRQALYTSENFFKGALTYWTEFGLTMTTTVRYTDERPGYYKLDTDTTPTDVLPSYWTTDIKLEQRLFENWLLSLQCNNLFDKEYDTYMQSFMNHTTQSEPTMEGYPGAGRCVFFSVAYEY